MVLAKIDDLGLDVKLLNVADPGVSEELIERGGKRQEPYLVDEDKNVEMYESFAINNYLDEHYGAKKTDVAEDVGESTKI